MRTLLRAVICAILFGWIGTARAETCIQLNRVTAAFDNIDVLISPSALTLDAIACHCEGTCASSLATWALSDRAGNSISLTGTLTCSTGTGNSTWASVDTSDTDRNLTTGEGLEVSVTNSPTSNDYYTVCVRFS